MANYDTTGQLLPSSLAPFSRALARFAARPMAQCLGALALLLVAAATVSASEADLAIPDLCTRAPSSPSRPDDQRLACCCSCGSFVICGTLGISLYLRMQIKQLPAHKSMLDVAEIIFQTCKTYLIQQGKFLLMLFALIAAAIAYYFWISHEQAEPGAEVISAP